MILSYYNGFVKKGNRVKERESQIDVLLNQRFDLIPNIVNCVKGYAKHEKTTLENVTKLRSDYQNNGIHGEIVSRQYANDIYLIRNVSSEKEITIWCEKPTPLGVGWIALNT